MCRSYPCCVPSALRVCRFSTRTQNDPHKQGHYALFHRGAAPCGSRGAGAVSAAITCITTSTAAAAAAAYISTVTANTTCTASSSAVSASATCTAASSAVSAGATCDTGVGSAAHLRGHCS